MKKSYVFLATGFEEIEALTVVDVLRRAGIEVVTVSVTDALEVEGAHNIVVKADTMFDDNNYADAQWLILPGGMPGATNLVAHDGLRLLLVNQHRENRGIAAICASPAVVLGKLGLLQGRHAVCYPGFERSFSGIKWEAKPVAIDGNIITANGPAAANPFALAIVSHTLDREKALDVAEGMLLYEGNYEFFF